MYLVSSPSVESTVQVATFRPLFLWVVWGMSQNKSKYLLYYKNDQDNTKICCSRVFNLTDPREQLFVNAETGNEAAMHSVERTLAFCCVRLTFCRCFSEYCCRGQDVKSSSHQEEYKKSCDLGFWWCLKPSTWHRQKTACLFSQALKEDQENEHFCSKQRQKT